MSKHSLYPCLVISALCAFVPTTGSAQDAGQSILDDVTPVREPDISKMTPEQILDVLEDTVDTIVQREYVRADSLDEIKLRYGAIKGRIAALNDRHSVFLTPDEAKQFRAEMEGKFYGIGASLALRDGRVHVAKVMPGSPAMKAGVKQGDIIVAVDEKPTYDETLDETVGRIRGDEGTAVALTIVREGSKKVLEKTVVRGKVVTKPEVLTWKLKRAPHGKKIMVITMPDFHTTAIAGFDAAVAATLESHADGMVIDLRGNPGGLLLAAQHIACAWLDASKQAVLIEHRGRPDQALKCKTAGALRGMPTAVLIDKYSASASEIVTGALQDYGAARIIGETSYGKGSVQAYMNFPDGSMLRLTVDLWKTPLGHPINKIGVTPDEKVKSDEEARKKGKDAQLDAAIRHLTRK